MQVKLHLIQILQIRSDLAINLVQLFVCVAARERTWLILQKETAAEVS